MTMKRERRTLYTALSNAQMDCIDAAYDAATEEIGRHGYKCLSADQAENLVGAIALYWAQSNAPGLINAFHCNQLEG